MWFELGFAISANKPVVLVCSSEREAKFPFDVQHRNIIRYSNDSHSDFINLQKQIVSRIKATLHKEKSLQKISDSPLASLEGLSAHEVVVLAVIAENLAIPGDSVAVHRIKNDVDKAGFTKIAAQIGLKMLLEKGFISFDQGDDDFVGYSLTDKGWQWILRNQERFQIQKPAPDDDIPF